MRNGPGLSGRRAPRAPRPPPLPPTRACPPPGAAPWGGRAAGGPRRAGRDDRGRTALGGRAQAAPGRGARGGEKGGQDAAGAAQVRRSRGRYRRRAGAAPHLPSARFMPASAARRGSAAPLPARRRFCFRRQSASSATAAAPGEDEPGAAQRSCSKATGSVRFLIPRPAGPAADGARWPRLLPVRAAVAAAHGNCRRRGHPSTRPRSPATDGARGPSAAPANRRRAPAGPTPRPSSPSCGKPAQRAPRRPAAILGKGARSRAVRHGPDGAERPRGAARGSQVGTRRCAAPSAVPGTGEDEALPWSRRGDPFRRPRTCAWEGEQGLKGQGGSRRQ